MYSSPEIFAHYRDYAYNIFKYLQSKIMRYFQCTLHVDYADMVNYTFANIRRPNQIVLHIENIIQQVGSPYKTNDVISMIFIALTHELFHAEQLMSQEQYRSSDMYKGAVEVSVNTMAYNFLLANKNEIDTLYKIDLDLSYLQTFIKVDGDRFYKTCSPEELYKHIIMNVIFRRDDEYKKFEESVLDKYPNIIIDFNRNANLLIKSNGEYCSDKLDIFNYYINHYIGRYDCYTVSISVINKPYRDIGDAAHISFELSDRKIYPMSFGKD